jgi:diguanylate cyclase (GGDEF)-like protein
MMISLKRYLDSAESMPNDGVGPEAKEILSAIVDAYRSALMEMENCGVEACPALGGELKNNLASVMEKLSAKLNSHEIAEIEIRVRELLQDWGRLTARHYQQKARDVKDLLLVMARTAESVGERDQRCAHQIQEVTTRLKRIGNLDDLTQIRASIEANASELKSSIDRMTTEGRTAIDRLRVEVSSYQVKLEEAEYVASCDALTGLGSRLSVEGQLRRRIEAGAVFCAVMIDIDGFKQVNDVHGHLAGDELLRQFAVELRSACRSTDIVGRWGGDEFIVLLDCHFQEARARADRLLDWVCGNYTVQGRAGSQQIHVDASIGLAEYVSGETLKGLLDRADAEMYLHKSTSRLSRDSSKRSSS